MYPPPRRILKFFRSLLKKRHTQRFRTYNWNESISTLRNIVLPLVENNPQQLASFENTCHALRTLHSLSLHYDMISRQSGEKNGMTNLALSISAATTIKQLENVLRFKLSELSIPGIVLALSPYLTAQLAPAQISLIIPGADSEVEKQLPIRVREPRLVPKIVFPHGKRFSVTLELLFHNAKYIGYVFFSNGAENLLLYDDVKELLSQSLYKLYLQENRVKAHMLVITDRAKLVNTIPLSPVEHDEIHGHVQVQDILDYMIDHLDEMLTLEKMSQDFHLSKSHLARRIKALTGYSMQTLHELLKIEQAKDLIKSGTLKMNDIAARLGYTNPNYFSNVFKKVTGLSPLNWAERN
ncbi:MAG: helix-turn-helix transcriptional regulator [Treponema sp.]|nr:helix-turn-helix transcriptional regulator [Treponema sp.]